MSQRQLTKRHVVIYLLINCSDDSQLSNNDQDTANFHAMGAVISYSLILGNITTLHK